jgi:hypothetical protein
MSPRRTVLVMKDSSTFGMNMLATFIRPARRFAPEKIERQRTQSIQKPRRQPRDPDFHRARGAEPAHLRLPSVRVPDSGMPETDREDHRARISANFIAGTLPRTTASGHRRRRAADEAMASRDEGASVIGSARPVQPPPLPETAPADAALRRHRQARFGADGGARGTSSASRARQPDYSGAWTRRSAFSAGERQQLAVSRVAEVPSAGSPIGDRPI